MSEKYFLAENGANLRKVTSGMFSVYMYYICSRYNVMCTVTVVRVRIRLLYTDLVNEMHLENWAGIQDQRRNSNQCR